MYILKTLYGGKCAEQLSYGFKILEKLGSVLTKFKVTTFGGFFENWVST